MVGVPRWTRWLVATTLALGALATPALAATPNPSPAPASDPAVAAEGERLASFGIGPAGSERPDERPFLVAAAGPGSVLYDHVAVINQAADPVDLTLYAADALTADGGGLAIRERAATSNDLGSWITVGDPTPAITVPAQSPETGLGYVIVPITIAIPANAQPGDHVAGVVASLISLGSSSTSQNIELEQRVAARVYVRVDGPLAPGLEITSLRAAFRSGGVVAAGSVEVSYTLRNTGNVRMAVEPSARVAGPFGLLATERPGDRVDEILPGGEVQGTITVPDVWPLVAADVTVSANGAAAPGADDPGVGAVTERTRVWAVPWVPLAVLLLLALVLVIRRRRRVGRARRGGTRLSAAADRDIGAGQSGSGPLPDSGDSGASEPGRTRVRRAR